MPRWRDTPVIYKIGIVGIVVSFVIYFVGFASPAWYKTDTPGSSLIEYGLWQVCKGEVSNCIYLNDNDTVIIRDVEIAACLLHLAAVMCAFVTFSTSNNHPMSVILPGMSAGVIGFVGEIVFATWGIRNRSTAGSSSLYWSFGLAISGSLLLIIFCIFAVAGTRFFGDSEASDESSEEFSNPTPNLPKRHKPERDYNQQYNQHDYNQQYNQHDYHKYEPYQTPYQDAYDGDSMPMKEMSRYQPAYRSNNKQSYQQNDYHFYGGNPRQVPNYSHRYGRDEKY